MKVNTRSVAQACALAMVVAIAQAGESRRSLQTHEVVPAKELLITAPEVVDSKKAKYPGPWSFGFLVEQAFGREQAPHVVSGWLATWAEGDQKAGVASRPGVNDLIRQWQQVDGFKPSKEEEWQPNFENAPFRLLAIVNRMDLALPLDSLRDDRGRVKTPLSGSGSVYYASSLLADSSAGEGRFVFGVVDADGEVLDGGTTLIFEYGLPGKRTQEGVLNWAMDWHALGKAEAFDGSYLSALAGVTGKFTRAIPEEPVANGPRFGARIKTQLLRVRTNDGSFGATREFREFRVSRSADKLEPGPLAGTPRAIFFEPGTRENRWLARWLRKEQTGSLNPATVRDHELRVPQFNLAFPTEARLGNRTIPAVAMVAPVPGNNADYHWDSHGLNDSRLRRTFSLQTCCGCHCGDTRTAFFHVAPRAAGSEARLSDYLRNDGKTVLVKDPGSKRSVKLGEMEERRLVFESLLNPDFGTVRIKKIRENRLARVH